MLVEDFKSQDVALHGVVGGAVHQVPGGPGLLVHVPHPDLLVADVDLEYRTGSGMLDRKQYCYRVGAGVQPQPELVLRVEADVGEDVGGEPGARAQYSPEKK